jgi:hypothetical protein
MDNFLKNLIIVLNTVLRMIVIEIVNFTGCNTESGQMSYVTNAVFICIFFNTGFLVMLCNANLEDQGMSLFNGNDSDFNAQWFNSQGETIVGSMVFNTWFPFMMECGNKF